MALSKKQLDHFESILRKLKAQLTNEMSKTSSDVRNVDGSKGYSQHQADEGTDDFVRDISIQVTGKEREILRQVERSLEKIEEGTYGICDLTQEEIPLKRLEAVPYATMTVQAQQMLEKGLIS